ncbi:hypothetical protein [Antarcticimicrobium luteum]|uniref:Peptidase M15 n=1 Tax=Antarcticimicrobium luteum TaxID=2547397 RepID=A0A4R5UVH5_9RHOB|nr:hypothetical protein [Antarcticimicrobium luteum]TDK43244.1 hypothetical protein E1832_18020 [Antarcticimicrobium luteum]
MRGLEELGRVRLSKHFYFRDFLYSEIGNFHHIPNLPDDPDLAIETGRALCETLLDPLEETFGRVAIRSGYRSAALNRFGNENRLNCAANDNPLECHIWDRGRGADRVAGASVAIPWFAQRYAQGRDWRDLAWWLYDHIPFSEVWFFPNLCAFNIAWRPRPQRRIGSYIAPRGTLLAAGADPGEATAQRRARYGDFPPFRGVVFP